MTTTEERDIEIKRRKKLERALEDIGNIIGGPTMGYASKELQLTEYEQMAERVHHVVLEALRKDPPGTTYYPSDVSEVY